MPSMANIVIKKADGTTDVTWTAATPSAGDSSPAVWRSNSVSGVMGFRPKFQLLLRDNAAKTGRVFQASFSWPNLVTDGSQVSRIATTPIRFEGTLPDGVAVSDLKEAIYQATNILASALVRGSLEEQYAPT